MSHSYVNQHTATHCNTLQHTATHCNALQHTATHCNTLQRSATHCNTLQHTATRCNTLQHTAPHFITLHYIATHCTTLRYTATHCNILNQHYGLEPMTSSWLIVEDENSIVVWVFYCGVSNETQHPSMSHGPGTNVSWQTWQWVMAHMQMRPWVVAHVPKSILLWCVSIGVCAVCFT